MFGQLSADAIEAYDGKAFYGYSLLGAKIENMSANPRVCIEVDSVTSAAEWSSAVARGLFHLLEGDAATNAVERISDDCGRSAARLARPGKRGIVSSPRALI